MAEKKSKQVAASRLLGRADRAEGSGQVPVFAEPHSLPGPALVPNPIRKAIQHGSPLGHTARGHVSVNTHHPIYSDCRATKIYKL